MAGGATTDGMSLPRSYEGGGRGAVAPSAVSSQRRRGNVGLHRRGMAMGMATKIG